jgi:phosphoribosyl-ATP pyrophosphohydrolase
LGEEAVEVVIEAVSGKDSKFIEENADLLLHMLVLLNNKGYSLSDVLKSMKKKLKKRD